MAYGANFGSIAGAAGFAEGAGAGAETVGAGAEDEDEDEDEDDVDGLLGADVIDMALMSSSILVDELDGILFARRRREAIRSCRLVRDLKITSMYSNVRMYLCMHVCMYVCMYACTYVCIHVSIEIINTGEIKYHTSLIYADSHPTLTCFVVL